VTQNIELIYFDSCPNAEAARVNLRQALKTLDIPVSWQEWEQGNAAAPAHVREYGSPTILIDGRDVTGVGAGVTAAACRADGAPSAETIQAALSEQGQDES
jgi:hypothetical protein